ncbi:MAG: cell division protein FtsA, partial [Microgenomates group bacterium]
MPQQAIITAIDLGTDTCVTLIAAQNLETRTVRLLGVSAIPARGMKKSQIIDLEQVFETISESLDAAERMAGLDVKSAYVAISGAHIKSLNSKGVVAVSSPEQEINHDDVTRVIEAARAISLSSDREIMHVIPKDFKVDSQEGIKDPVGMTGVRLESEAHIITGMSTALRNLEKCIMDLGLTVDGFVFSGLASASVVLTETEKELGVALIDIGAGTTSLSVYVDGTIEFSASLPIGARHITQDIALGTRISIDTAEKIKIALSEEGLRTLKPHAGESKQEFNKRRKVADKLNISDYDNSDSSEELSKRTIVESIMTPRMQEIFDLVLEQLKKNNLTREIPAGVVLTGGGAETVYLVEVAKRVLNLPARVGEPTEIEGMTSDIRKPAFATSIGLIEYGKQNHGGTVTSGFKFPSFFSKDGSIIQKIVQGVKSLL